MKRPVDVIDDSEVIRPEALVNRQTMSIPTESYLMKLISKWFGDKTLSSKISKVED